MKIVCLLLPLLSLASFVQATTTTEPWLRPASPLAKLVAPDPGIWTVDNFLSPQEADQFLAIIKRVGFERNMFGPCTHKNLDTIHRESETKFCMMMSPTSICEGPYQLSACQHPMDHEDGAFVQAILDRFSSIWPQIDEEPRPLMSFQHILAGAGAEPIDVHADDDELVSSIIYLSDGGAPTIFPHVNVSVAPKKGMASMWLNLHEDGSPNNNAQHAALAHPKDAGERMIAVMVFEDHAYHEILWDDEDDEEDEMDEL